MGRDERGVALVLAIFVVSMLVALVLEFDRMTRTDLLAAGNFRDTIKAFYLAKAGIAAARGILKEDSLYNGQYDGLDEIWATGLPSLATGEGSIRVLIHDEAGKLNPNHLVGGPTRKRIPAKVAQMRRLLTLLKLDPDLVDVMVDWIDSDDEPERFGAERAYYAGLAPPYKAKNGPFESLSELRLLKGVTEEVYRALAPYLTVATPEHGRTNINTADPVVLQAMDSRISPQIADGIVKARPFRRLQDLDRVTGMEQVAKELRAIGQAYDIRSDIFSITSEGRVHDTTRVIRAAVVRSLFPNGSPEVRVVSWRVE